MSSHVEILQGPSGSGKSTYAKEREEMRPDVVVISRDRIREELLGKEGLKKYFENGLDYCLEEYITDIEHKLLAKSLAKHKDVIIDNTNLKKKYILEYIEILNDFGVWPEYVSIKRFNTPKEVCKERISKRDEKPISDEVLDKQFEQLKSADDWSLHDVYKTALKEKRKWFFNEFQIDKYIPDKEKERAIIVDLDGTLCHRAIIDGLKMRSFYDYDLCDTDKPDEAIKFLVESVSYNGTTILFTSGRKSSGRDKTMKWIKENLNISTNRMKLIMRDEDDNRSDAVVKYELFNKYIRNRYNVLFAIDDRKRVIQTWEELGIKVLNAGSLNDDY